MEWQKLAGRGGRNRAILDSSKKVSIDIVHHGRVVDQRTIRCGLHFQYTGAARLALFNVNHRKRWIDEDGNPINDEFLDHGRFLDDRRVLNSLPGVGRWRSDACCPGSVLD